MQNKETKPFHHVRRFALFDAKVTNENQISGIVICFRLQRYMLGNKAPSVFLGVPLITLGNAVRFHAEGTRML